MIDKETNWYKRQIKEAIHIRQLQTSTRMKDLPLALSKQVTLYDEPLVYLLLLLFSERAKRAKLTISRVQLRFQIYNWRASIASETLTGVKMKKSGMFVGERAKRARHYQG